MATQPPIEEFNSLLSSSSILFIVFYRGHWCPFCQAYIRTLQSISPSINELGGKTLAITSEDPKFLPDMRKVSGYNGPAIVDTENVLAPFLKEKYGLDVAITDNLVTQKKGYTKGMAQPAILVLRKGEKTEDILEKWAIVPATMNLGGAGDRPALEQIWDNAKAKFEGASVVHTEYARQGLLATLRKTVLGW